MLPGMAKKKREREKRKRSASVYGGGARID